MRVEVTSDDIRRLPELFAALQGAVVLLPLRRGTVLAGRVVRDRAKASATFRDRPQDVRRRAFGSGVVPRPLRASIAARPASVRAQVLRARPDGSVYPVYRRVTAAANVVTTGARKRAPNSPRYGYVVERGGRSGQARGKDFLASAFRSSAVEQGAAFFRGASEEAARINRELSGEESVRKTVLRLENFTQLHI